MDKSATRFGRTAIVTGCLLIAGLGLVVLAPHPDNVNKQLQSTAWPSRTVATQVSHAGVTYRPQHNVAPELSATAVDENIWLSQQHSSTFDRFEAISALGDSHDAIAEPTLVGLLYDQDPAIRESAVESLASRGTHGAIQALGFALTDTNPLIRRTATEFLAEIGTRDALAALAATLTDPDADVRLAAVYELADSENAAASALLQQFLADTDPSVRQVAGEFLNDESR